MDGTMPTSRMYTDNDMSWVCLCGYWINYTNNCSQINIKWDQP